MQQLDTAVLVNRSRHILAAFLAIEIQTGVTFVELARTRQGTPRHPQLKANAISAARAVERLKARVPESAREEIDTGLYDLKRRILMI